MRGRATEEALQEFNERHGIGDAPHRDGLDSKSSQQGEIDVESLYLDQESFNDEFDGVEESPDELPDLLS